MKRFLLDSLLCTLFVFIFLFGLLRISNLTILNAFDPIGKAFSDLELTDITFSQLRETKSLKVDSNIWIVNIGEISRADIARQILVISSCKPKVIGLDARFVCDWTQDTLQCPALTDTLGNMMLSYAISQAPNMVMVSKISGYDKAQSASQDKDVFTEVISSYPPFLINATEGFANLETDAEGQEDLKMCRRFNPRISVNGKDQYAFAVQIAMKFDSMKAKKFLDRNIYSEVINYRGNTVDIYGASQDSLTGIYPVLDVDQALDTNRFITSMLKDKIVIMGYLGKDIYDTSWDDKFFTPLNEEYVGRSRPDMYGVVVHANIVSMILNEDYIDELGTFWENVIAFVLVFLNVILFYKIVKKIPVWFDSLSLLIQVIQVVFLVFVMLEIFDLFNFKINLTASLGAIALVGTSFEIYNSVIKALFKYLNEKLPRLTKKRQAVLTPESSE
jgi:CHASE2 domain-containing sensor protein